MAEADQNYNQVDAGGGLGKEYVSKSMIIFLLVLMILVICLLLWGIARNLPQCAGLYQAPSSANNTTNTNVRLPVANENANQATNRNSNTGRAGNTATNTAATNANAAATSTNVANATVNANLTGNANVATNTNVTTGQGADAANVKPTITSLSPVRGAIDGGTKVLIQGSGFSKEAKVLFDGEEASKVDDAVQPDTIFVNAPPGTAPQVVDVIVRNPDGSSAILPRGFTYVCQNEAPYKLLLLVILAGALGGALHAARSLIWYIGNRELRYSWTPMYIMLPLSGAAMAVVFYLIFYGGFLLNTQGGNQSNSWWIVGVGVLVGMFSQQAALKLQDIAEVTLTKPEKGKDARPQRSEPVAPGHGTDNIIPVIEFDPNKGPFGGGGVITIKGTGFNNITKVVTDTGQVLTVTKGDKPNEFRFTIPSGEAGKISNFKVYFDDNPNPITVKYTYE